MTRPTGSRASPIPRTLVTQYAHNGLGDLTSLASPDTGMTTNTYDETGNVISSVDARGKTTTYSYDALNRLAKTTFADNQMIVFQYDQGTNGKGRLTKMTDLEWVYDVGLRPARSRGQETADNGQGHPGHRHDLRQGGPYRRSHLPFGEGPRVRLSPHIGTAYRDNEAKKALVSTITSSPLARSTGGSWVTAPTMSGISIRMARLRRFLLREK